MPIPFDMIAVMLFLGHYTALPAPRPTPSLWHSLSLVGFACVFLFAAASLVNLAAVRRLRSGRLILPARRRLAGGIDIGLRFVLAAVYMITIDVSAFPWAAAARLFGGTPHESFAIQLLGLAPYLPLFFCAWMPMFAFHRETSFGVWTRASFLLHKARYNLFLLLAWIPFALLAGWLSGFLVALPIVFLAAAWSFPFLLARAWGCRKIEDQEVLAMVKRLEQRAGARFSRVYLWEPGGGGVQNAAAVGILRPFRYLFLTPALIRNMGRSELEAVILHELGHVRKKHLLFYMITSLAGINIAVLAGAFAPFASETERFFLTAILVLGYFRLVFGWLSRNMERQADLFALEKSGSASGLANALEKLGLSAGHIRLAESWHHLGIASRVDFLRRAERDPAIASGHNAHVSRLMGLGYALAVIVIAGMAWLVYADSGAGGVVPAPAGGDVAHWRRVMLLMPGNSAAPLHLAHSLAAAPEARGEAAGLAALSMRLSCGTEEKAAAAKLMEELRGGEALSEMP